MAHATPTATGPLADGEFDRLRVCFQNLGDRLSDSQMLDLADAYHEMLRQRREVRAHHPLSFRRPESADRMPSPGDDGRQAVRNIPRWRDTEPRAFAP